MTDPLVASEVDLRDFAFMPLDVVRLRDSGITAKATGEEFRAAVLLWCAAWHQIPAASLPNDDAELANLCGYGRSVKEWKKIRNGALHGWVLCSDGRLYHKAIAEKANEAWRSKLARRSRTEAARNAREEARQRQSQPSQAPIETHVTDNVTNIVTDTVIEDVTGSKGQGQGQGQGYSKKKRERKEKLSLGKLTDDGYPVDFEEFWTTYPRKVDKLNACKAWEKAIDGGVENAEIIEGAKRYFDSCRAKGTEPEYIAHASTWLNGERWKDEVFEEKPETPPEVYRAHSAAHQAWLAGGRVGPRPELDDFRAKGEP